jgi:hypothetical protein
MEISLLVSLMFMNDVIAMFFFMIEVPESGSNELLRNSTQYYRRIDLFWTKKMKINILLSTLYIQGVMTAIFYNGSKWFSDSN